MLLKVWTMLESLECNFEQRKHQVRECQEPRSSLFYKHWQWSVSWYQPEITALRISLDADQVASVLDRRRHWEKVRWDNSISMGERRLRPTLRSAITPEVVQQIETVRQWLVSAGDSVKTVFFTGQITVYANDRTTTDSAQHLAESLTMGPIRVREAVITQSPNTVYLKRPYDYGYRTYFRSQHLDDNTIVNLKKWAKGMGSEVRACPSLRDFLAGRHNRSWYVPSCIWDHYFVDHNDPKLDVWLSMLCPGLVRKTMSIESAAK